MFSSSRGTSRLRYAVPAGVASLSLLLAACGGDSSGGSDSGAPAAGALDKASGVTTVSFWHAMDGKNAEQVVRGTIRRMGDGVRKLDGGRFALSLIEPESTPTPIARPVDPESLCHICGDTVASFTPAAQPVCSAHTEGMTA